MMIWGYIHVMIWGHVHCTCDDMGVRTCKAVHLKFKGVETQSVDCTLLKKQIAACFFYFRCPR